MTRHLEDRDLITLGEGRPEAPAPAPAVREHLDACPACRRRLAEYRTALRLASELPAPEWSRQQARNLAVRVRRAVRSRGKERRRTWIPALAGAATALLVLLGIQELAQPGLYLGPMDRGLVAAAGPDPGLAAAGDEEVAQGIDDYLIDTATEDELMSRLDAVGEEEVYALLARGQGEEGE